MDVSYQAPLLHHPATAVCSETFTHQKVKIKVFYSKIVLKLLWNPEVCTVQLFHFIQFSSVSLLLREQKCLTHNFWFLRVIYYLQCPVLPPQWAPNENVWVLITVMTVSILILCVKYAQTQCVCCLEALSSDRKSSQISKCYKILFDFLLILQENKNIKAGFS